MLISFLSIGLGLVFVILAVFAHREEQMQLQKSREEFRKKLDQLESYLPQEEIVVYRSRFEKARTLVGQERIRASLERRLNAERIRRQFTLFSGG